MPNETFFKLNKKKQELIKQAFYIEFASHSFDEASITKVVKRIEIAKGSVYQYFENKLNLFMYLLHEAGAKKVSFLEPVKRESFSSFWDYMRQVYIAGIEFDSQCYLESHFLQSAFNNSDSPSVKLIFKKWNKSILDEFAKKVQFEIDSGLFHNHLPADKMAFILKKNLDQINDYMLHFNGLDMEKNILSSKGIYSGNMSKKLLDSVDEHFILLKKTFNK